MSMSLHHVMSCKDSSMLKSVRAFVSIRILSAILALPLMSSWAFGEEGDANSPIAAQMAAADKAVAQIVAIPADKRTFDNTFMAMDDLVTRLQTDTGMIAFMANVSPDADKRDAGNKTQEDV